MEFDRSSTFSQRRSSGQNVTYDLLFIITALWPFRTHGLEKSRVIDITKFIFGHQEGYSTKRLSTYCVRAGYFGWASSYSTAMLISRLMIGSSLPCEPWLVRLLCSSTTRSLSPKALARYC
jgi:hypothetical protein